MCCKHLERNSGYPASKLHSTENILPDSTRDNPTNCKLYQDYQAAKIIGLFTIVTGIILTLNLHLGAYY